MTRPLRRTALALWIAIALPFASPAPAQEPAADDQAEAAPGEELRWPRIIQEGDTTFTVYQPQIDKFGDAILEARAAMEVETTYYEGRKQQTYSIV